MAFSTNARRIRGRARAICLAANTSTAHQHRRDARLHIYQPEFAGAPAAGSATACPALRPTAVRMRLQDCFPFDITAASTTRESSSGLAWLEGLAVLNHARTRSHVHHRRNGPDPSGHPPMATSKTPAAPTNSYSRGMRHQPRERAKTPASRSGSAFSRASDFLTSLRSSSRIFGMSIFTGQTSKHAPHRLDRKRQPRLVRNAHELRRNDGPIGPE